MVVKIWVTEPRAWNRSSSLPADIPRPCREGYSEARADMPWILCSQAIAVERSIRETTVEMSARWRVAADRPATGRACHLQTVPCTRATWSAARQANGGQASRKKYAPGRRARSLRRRADARSLQLPVRGWATMRMQAAIKSACPHVVTACGGVYSTFRAATVLAHEASLDVIVCGEGDEAALRFVEALADRVVDRRAIPGLAFRAAGGEPVLTPESSPIRELDGFRVGYELIDDRDRYRSSASAAPRSCSSRAVVRTAAATAANSVSGSSARPRAARAPALRAHGHRDDGCRRVTASGRDLAAPAGGWALPGTRLGGPLKVATTVALLPCRASEPGVSRVAPER